MPTECEQNRLSEINPRYTPPPYLSREKLRARVATQCMILKASCTADFLNPDGTLNPYPDPMACSRC